MHPREGAKNLYKESKIEKVSNIIIITNYRLVYDQLRKKLPENFSELFTLNTQLHHHNTRGNKLIVPSVNTSVYGSNSITLKAIKESNEMQNFVKADTFSPEMTYSKLLKSLKTYIENQ